MLDSGISSLAPVAGLDVTLTDGVLSVTINRPDSLNSLTVPVITGIADIPSPAGPLERSARIPTGGIRCR